MVLYNFQVKCPCGRKNFNKSVEDGITLEEMDDLRARVVQHAHGAEDHITVDWEQAKDLPVKCYSVDWSTPHDIADKIINERTSGVRSTSGLSRTRPLPPAASTASSSSSTDRINRIEDAVMSIAIGLQRLGEDMKADLQLRRRSRSRNRYQ